MKNNKLKLILLLITLALISASSVSSGDIFNLMISGEQDSLVVGKLKEKYQDDEIKLEVHHVVSGKDPGDMIDLRITLQEIEIETGDSVLVSMNERNGEETEYQTKWGIFKVTSTDIEELEVKDGPHLFENHDLALQVFLNSKGEIDDFYFMGQELHIRENDETYEIYPEFDPETPYPEVAEMLSQHYEDKEIKEIDTKQEEDIKTKEEDEEGVTALPMYIIIAVLIIASFVVRLVYYERKK